MSRALCCASLLVLAGVLLPEDARAEAATGPPDAGVAEEPASEAAAGLSAPDSDARLAAARSLAESPDPAALDSLAAALATEPMAEVRAAMVRAVAAIRTGEAQDLLVRVARTDRDFDVRSLAARLSGVMVPPSPPPAPPPAEVVPEPPGPTAAEAGAPRWHRGSGRRLLIAGGVVFGAPHLACLVAGIVMMAVDDAAIYWPLLIPGVGPALVGATLYAIRGLVVPLAISLGVLSTAAQLVGLGLVGGGLYREIAARTPPDGDAGLPAALADLPPPLVGRVASVAF